MGFRRRPDRLKMGEHVVMAKTLTIFLAADVSKLNRSLKDAGNSVGGFGGTLDKVLGPALLATAAAAGALAIKLGIDGVQAAIADEAASAKLAQTLENLGLAHDTQKVEDYISVLERSLGVADDELRPAYDRLARSIGDTEQANQALALALDVSAGSGKSLDAVVQALGRAYDGNVTGLSRLGAGIDAATLKTGDMQQITAALSATFAGQAQNSAETYEGQIRRLNVAADNMKEAFGAGLLKALGDTNDMTNDLVTTAENLEPLFEGTGKIIGTFTRTALADLDKNLGTTAESTEEVAEATAGFNTIALIAGGFVNELTNAFIGVNSPIQTTARGVGKLSGEAATFNRVISGTVQAALDTAAAFDTAAVKTADLAAALRDSYNEFIKIAKVNANYQVTSKMTADQIERNETATTTLTASTENYSRASSGASAATVVSTEKFDAQAKTLGDLNQKFKDQTADLVAAKDAVANYASTLSKQITQGFNLGAGFTMENGEVDAGKWLAGVDSEVSKYEWYGNVLARVQQDAGTNGERLREYLAAQGVEQGAVMGQALIDNGLVKTMADKLALVQATADTAAQAMVPAFLQAGIDQAIGNVNATAVQMSKETKRLNKIGENMGENIGAGIKKEIAAAVAQAVKDAAAARTAALAEVSAREAAANAAFVEQQTAQSLARLIRNSDNRAGRNVQPVLT